VVAALEPFEHELFEAARLRRSPRPTRRNSRSTRWPRWWVPNDRLSAGKHTRPSVSTIVRVDYAALVRGRTHPGEVCEIVGGSPIPVSVAQRLLDDSFLKLLLVDGTDVRAVSHPGRTIPARLRSAVEERHPECDIEGCHVTATSRSTTNLPIEEGGLTAMSNLDRLCCHHHEHKHRHRLRLVGEPGRMRFIRRASGCRRDVEPRGKFSEWATHAPRQHQPRRHQEHDGERGHDRPVGRDRTRARVAVRGEQRRAERGAPWARMWRAPMS